MHKRTGEERENAIKALGMSWVDNYQGTAFSLPDFDRMLVSHFRLCWHTEQYHNSAPYHEADTLKAHMCNEAYHVRNLMKKAKKYDCAFFLGDDGFSNYLEKDGRKYFFPIAEEKD